MSEKFLQFNPKAEQPKQEKPAETTERKRPGGSMPEWSLWKSRVEPGEGGQLKEKGVRAPDGTYHQLQEGEKFVINKGEGGDYEAVIIGQNGEERVLRKSAAKEKAEREQQDKDKLAELRKSLGIQQGAESGVETKETDELNEKVEVELQKEIESQVDKKSELEKKYENFSGWLEDITHEDQQSLISSFSEYKITGSDANEILFDYSKLIKQLPRIKMEHAVALHSYAHEFEKMNRELRSDDIYFESFKKVQKLNEALDLLPNYMGTVYRGIQIAAGESLDLAIKQIEAEYKEGEIVQFKSFLSTAEKIEGSRGGAVNYIIESKHGKKMSDIGVQGEYEVLFKTNSRFKVIKKEKDETNRLTIYLEEVG